MQIISAKEINQSLDWSTAIKALRDGHAFQRAKTGDTLLEMADKKLLVRSAWIEGLAAGTKAVTVVPKNTILPSIHGEVILFDDANGSPRAILDGIAMTKWKTAGDSALGSEILSRIDAKTFLMIGAGSMAEPLIRAHISVRPQLNRIILWNRTVENAQTLKTRLADLNQSIEVTKDLDQAVAEANIISSATMSKSPIIKGSLLKPGCHLDLVGAYTPDQREADDAAITRARLFADCFDTTIADIGEFADPISRNIIKKTAVIADLYDLTKNKAGRLSDEEITLYKNGGGGHLDIMLAAAIVTIIQKP